jgi:ferredoxin
LVELRSVAVVTGRWRVTADRERCMGTGACAFTAPDVFEVDAEGRVAVIGEVVAGDERVRDAVDDCPMEALELIEGEAV